MFDMQYCIDNLVKILKTPSPTGNTKTVMDIVENEFKELNIDTYRTKGSLDSYY